MQKVKFTKALLNNQWHDNVTLKIDDQGFIIAIGRQGNDKADPNIEVVDGFALPGMPNCHSHAFQRAMAGLAEFSTSERDSFWTWRDVMYRFAQSITPDDLYHIARQLYLEMVTAGYTSVAEFHYLHHQKGGQPYDNPAEMSLAIIEAAKDVGLHLTHLPVLYMSSGFGNISLSDEQARFGHDIDHYCALWDQLDKITKNIPRQNLGAAFHSLRAVSPEGMDKVIQHVKRQNAHAPLHIHIAEQMKEVEDCLAWSGQRPVEWLLNHQELTENWCLIHATHMTEQETKALAMSGAVVGICPTTEANLGDGLFSLRPYLDQGGRVAIGSDSHISVSPVAELRLLEYGQRLKFQSRNITATKIQPHSGNALYHNALKGGVQAAGLNAGALEIGRRADLITLDPVSPLMVATPDKYLLDRFIFSGNQSVIKDVMVGGEWLIRAGSHREKQNINQKFQITMEKLLN